MDSIQTLYDVLYAFAIVVGISATFALALVAAGARHRLTQVRAAKVGAHGAIPMLEATSNDDRELVLR